MRRVTRRSVERSIIGGNASMGWNAGLKGGWDEYFCVGSRYILYRFRTPCKYSINLMVKADLKKDDDSYMHFIVNVLLGPIVSDIL